MVQRITTLTIVLCFALLTGCAGTADDLCTQAARHLEQCTGGSVAASPTCNPTNASRVLTADCAQLAAGSSRGTFVAGGGWGSFLDAPDHGGAFDEGGTECNPCDQWCDILNDCCSWCWPTEDHHDQAGVACAYQGGANWRRCNQCGWQFCLPSGQWAQCQRPQNPNRFPCAGGQTCRADGFCSGSTGGGGDSCSSGGKPGVCASDCAGMGPVWVIHGVCSGDRVCCINP